MSTASAIAGLSMSWSTGHAGEMLKLITTSPVANPIVMLDEVDKMHGHDMAPLEPTVLALLEQESAKDFRDEGLLLRINLGHVLWLGTANNLNAMSEPLRSRFTVVTVHEPTSEQAPAIIRSIYRKIRAGNRWGHRFSSVLDDNVIDKLVGYSPRELSHILPLACGKAARRGEHQIQPSDIPTRAINDKARIGFM
jgi:ATP-dependent Lon protease